MANSNQHRIHAHSRDLLGLAGDVYPGSAATVQSAGIGKEVQPMIRDAQYYRDRLAELEVVLAGTPAGRNVDQLMAARLYCKRRIRECEYEEAVAVILDSN